MNPPPQQFVSQSGPEKRRNPQASNKSESSEQIRKMSAFQDGGDTDDQRFPAKRGLDGNSGPQRCISIYTYHDSSMEPTKVEVAGPNIRIPLSSAWAQKCSMSVHKSAESNSSLDLTEGVQNHRISRRHDADDSVTPETDIPIADTPVDAGTTTVAPLWLLCPDELLSRTTGCALGPRSSASTSFGNVGVQEVQPVLMPSSVQ